VARVEAQTANDVREQQRATSAVMRAVARGQGLQPVMDEIIEAATRLCHGEYGSLHLLEGNELPALSHSGSSHHWDYDQEHAHLLDRTTMVGRAAVTREVVHIPDIGADPEYAYSGPRTFRVGLGVPILFEDDLIGAMGIIRRSPEPFADEQIELVKTFADQAAIAITNARLVDALQHQLEQQRAIGDVLRAIARSEGLQTVLDEIVETVSILGRGDNVRMWLVRDGFLHAVANGGWSDGWDYDRAHPHVIDASSASGRAALTKEPVHIPDVTADPEYAYDGPVTFRTNLSVPILLDDEVIGVFGIVHREARPFSQEVIDLVRTFADQAAVAIANARLIDAVEQQLEQQRAVAGVLGVVARGAGLAAVFDAVVEAAARLCSAEYGQICIADGDVFRLAGTFGANAAVVEYERAHPSPRDRTSVVGRVAVTGDVVHMPDTLADPEYTWEGQATGGYRAMLGVPIRIDEELIGVINVARNEPVPFTPDHIDLVKTFADHAAIAIAGARLGDAVERQLEQQQAIADILRTVARSEGLEAVFNVVADSATRLCHGDYGAVYLKEGETLVVAAQRYGQPGVFEYERENPHQIDRHTAIGRASVTRDVVHIPDTQEDSEYSWGAAGIMEYRSLLAAPILLDDELIGAMNVVKVAPEPFTDEQIKLMRTFADQAAIAIANARLLEAVERQLQQQQAISDVLGAVARAEGLESVLHELVEAACQLCGAQFGEVHLAQGDFLRLAAGHGGPPELYEFEREHPHPLAGDRTSVNGRVLLTGDVVHIPDIREDEEYAWSAANDAGIRALLGAPLMVEDQLVGVFNIVRTEPKPFADDEVELLRTFADQGAIAVANARLMEAVERQLEQQRAISDVLGAVARSEGLESVLRAVVEAACRLCQAQSGAVHLVEDDLLQLAVGHGGSPELYEFEKEHPRPLAGDRQSLNGRVLLSRDMVHIPDIRADEEYSLPVAEEAGVRANLGAPMLSEGELVGVFNVVRTEPVPFTDEQIELLRTFADQAAIAVANTRLMEAVERQRTELARFVSPQVAELVSSGEGERMLTGHRAYVTSMFFDLRGFTSFTELAEPEELFEVLREYHVGLGELIPEYEGTLEHFAGDGLMVFFNDPVPVENHELKAVQLALAAQQRFEELGAAWRKRGHELGLGIGIAAGYATLGRIGFEGRYDYGVLGTVTNLASRLSSAAEPSQTLISQRVYAAVEESVDAHQVGELELKGFGRPMPAFEVRGLKP
jgi:GAF domain-containing protein